MRGSHEPFVFCQVFRTFLYVRSHGCLMTRHFLRLDIIQFSNLPRFSYFVPTSFFCRFRSLSYATARRVNGKGTYEYLRQEFHKSFSHGLREKGFFMEQNHSSRPLISVLIPVYNAGKYLAETLTSIKNQT